MKKEKGIKVLIWILLTASIRSALITSRVTINSAKM